MNNLLSFASTMKSFGGVVLAIAILLAMVSIHEFGHYIAGKILGFKINEFAIGFGPAILKKRSKKTGELFSLRIIPLGGYCAFDGEDTFEDEEKSEEPFAEMTSSVEKEGGMVASTENVEEEYPEPKGEKFNDQAPWKRIIVLIAGATMNYLLALVLIVTMFLCLGRPTYQIIKQEPLENASQGSIQTYEEGLQTGDVILGINGKTMYLITDWQTALEGKKKGEIVEILVLRDGKKQTIDVTLVEDAHFVNMSDLNPLLYSLGIWYREEVTNKDGTTSIELTRGGGIDPVGAEEDFFQAIGDSFVYSWKIGGMVLRSLGELLTGKLGMESVGGPVTTIQVTSKVAASGVSNFLNIAALIGVNLAVFNLLPIPALDGSKVIFCIIEWIRKKPINRKVETMIHLVGIVFLFGFAILVDILHLF